MKSNTANRTIQQMTLDSCLLTILKTKDNHKMSRYDAFLWLVEHIHNGSSYSHEGHEYTLPQYHVTNSELAEVWHWSRPSVQKFIEELNDAGFIKTRTFRQQVRLLPHCLGRRTHQVVPRHILFFDSNMMTALSVSQNGTAHHHEVSLLHRTEGKRSEQREGGFTKTLSLIRVNFH